ncbi:MAG: DUF2183 domain-containing protein [Myxococcales bacterium]|nr:DUF2183 domain-containing protein [Myxococcales bacterium]
MAERQATAIRSDLARCAAMILVGIGFSIVGISPIHADQQAGKAMDERRADRGAETERAVRRHLERATRSVEAWLDVRWKGWLRGQGFERPRQILAYTGFGNGRRVWLRGRVLANRRTTGPGDDDRWWDNLLQSYQRWESDEIPDARLKISMADQIAEVRTDEEGFYEVDLAYAPGSTEETWHFATVELLDDPSGLRTVQSILVPGVSASFGVISDLDDTVIHTGVTNLLTAARLTFLGNAKTRKPLAGVAAFYRALREASPTGGQNPVFYVSSSAWNLYDLLRDFLALNEVPAGPLLLRDLGVDDQKFIKEKGHDHKLDKVERILATYPSLPFVLIGDSGQADPQLYLEAARRHGDRIRAIYIRDVDPGESTPRDLATDRAAEEARSIGTPMMRADDSLAMARHAASIGLVEESWIPRIGEEVKRDLERAAEFGGLYALRAE